MSHHTSTADVARSCIVELSQTAEKLETFIPAYLERECPHLDEISRYKALVLAYEVCGARAEDLLEEARRLRDASIRSRDLEPILRARGLYELSGGYLDVFKRLGPYLIERQRDAVTLRH